MNSQIVFVFWILAMGAGILWLTDHSTRPGPSSDVVSAWSAESSIRQSEDPCVIVFLHPHCPCSLSTMRQLNRIAAGMNNKTAVNEFVFVFYCPSDKPENWVDGKLWTMAKKLGRMIVDIDGVEARRFGATTSGHVFLLENDSLKFSGGITSGRGHDGDSPSADALRTLLNGGKSKSRFAVFGCEIVETRDKK